MQQIVTVEATEWTAVVIWSCVWLCWCLVIRDCSPQCDGSCYGPTIAECCHRECVGGCTGTSNTQCWVSMHNWIDRESLRWKETCSCNCSYVYFYSSMFVIIQRLLKFKLYALLSVVMWKPNFFHNRLLVCRNRCFTGNWNVIIICRVCHALNRKCWWATIKGTAVLGEALSTATRLMVAHQMEHCKVFFL